MTKKINFGSYVKMDLNEIRDNYKMRNCSVDKDNKIYLIIILDVNL